VLAAADNDRPGAEDLYLERRFELHVALTHGAQLVRECRSEGAALRWSFPDQIVLHTRNGVSPAALAELFACASEAIELPAMRPAPLAEIDPPRGWLEWAKELVGQLGDSTTASFLSRHSVVIRPGEWSVIVSPPLLHVRRNGALPGALLAVWRNRHIGEWLQELIEPAPVRCWQPTSGLRPPVIFTAGASGVLIHELVGHMVEADLTCSGSSPLAELAGATITATSLQVTDDPTRDDLPGAFSCDDEGVVSEPVSLVESGRLCGWLCDRARAAQLDSVPGRGRRPSWNRPPVPRISNLVVAAGSCSPHDMESELRHGLVVTRVAGASVDPISARAVVHVERGWEVRNGRRRRPLARCELTGPALEVLAHIDPDLGSDPAPEWRLGWCMKDGMPMPTGSEAPTILVHRLEVL
jgi:hypothetical protein